MVALTIVTEIYTDSSILLTERSSFLQGCSCGY
jgi:hypothetical protein